MGEEQTAQNNSVINVFNECLDAFAASEQLSEQEQNGLIRAIGELAVSSMAEGYLYGATEDSDLYQIADSLRQKIFLDDIPESNRQILKGMFYIINTAAHSVLPRITASQNDDLTVLKSMEGKTSPTENVDPKLLFNYKNAGMIFIRRLGSRGENVMVEMTPRGNGILEVYERYSQKAVKEER